MSPFLTILILGAASAFVSAAARAVEAAPAAGDSAPTVGEGEADFAALRAGGWKQVLSDGCTGDWQERWFLDGATAKVATDKEGMTVDASAGFAVLWTKQEFQGDLRIEYDFKRMDSFAGNGVNIIYIQATGKGTDGFDKDIAKWSDKRKEAKMSDYFNNMNTYHISYATADPDYIRGRRYMPLAGKKLDGTELKGGIEKDAGIFAKDQWIHVTIIKRSRDMFAEFKGPNKRVLVRLENHDLPPIEEGRIGLRLMTHRVSMFRNFAISVPDKEPAGRKD